MTRSSIPKTIILLVISIVFAVALAEALTRVTFMQWREFLSERFMRTEVGGGIAALSVAKANFDGYFAENNGDFRIRIQTNAMGLRNLEPTKAAQSRIWMVGDSITFGWGVAQSEILSSKTVDRLGRSAYNVASPGTDICGYRALLARMPKDISPTAVIIVLTIENDIRVYDCDANTVPLKEAPLATTISLSSLKQSLMKYSALYNFAALTLKKSPLIRDLLTGSGLINRGHTLHSHYPNSEIRHRTESAATELSKLRQFLPAHTSFAVLLVPARFEVRDGNDFFHKVRNSMNNALNVRNIDVIDPIAEFRTAGFVATHFAHDGHWSAKGHEIAARHATAWLRRQGL